MAIKQIIQSMIAKSNTVTGKSDANLTSAFSNGEIGLWTDGLKYRSKKDSNVYTPAVRPEDWEVVE